jgi:hypothetical protein
MEYKSNRQTLIIKDYGRYVQDLIEHTKTISDPIRRQNAAEEIIKIMETLSSHDMDPNELESVLWTHLMHIAQYDLPVYPPVTVIPPSERQKSERLPYPTKVKKFRYYGVGIKLMIERAIQMSEPLAKAEYTSVIVSYMKTLHKTWNRDNVTNDVIIKDFMELSKGQLPLPENINLDIYENVSKRMQHISRVNEASQKIKIGGKKKIKKK